MACQRPDPGHAEGPAGRGRLTAGSALADDGQGLAGIPDGLSRSHLSAAADLDGTVDGDLTQLDDRPGHRAVVDDPGELEQLAEPNGLVMDGYFEVTAHAAESKVAQLAAGTACPA